MERQWPKLIEMGGLSRMIEAKQGREKLNIMAKIRVGLTTERNRFIDAPVGE